MTRSARTIALLDQIGSIVREHGPVTTPEIAKHSGLRWHTGPCTPYQHEHPNPERVDETCEDGQHVWATARTAVDVYRFLVMLEEEGQVARTREGATLLTHWHWTGPDVLADLEAVVQF